MTENRISEEEASNLLTNCNIPIINCFSGGGVFSEYIFHEQNAEALLEYCNEKGIGFVSLYPFLERALYERARSKLRTETGITSEEIEKRINESRNSLEDKLKKAAEFFKNGLKEKD